MSSAFEDVIRDLAEEHAALKKVLRAMPDSTWDLPSHAPGWMVRDQVSHLAYFDEAAELAIRDPEAFTASVAAATSANSSVEEQYLGKGRAMTHGQLFDWWKGASSSLVAAARLVDPKARLPWYGPAMSGVSFLTARLMECWSHGLDVVDVAGVSRPDTDRLRHVAFISFRARPFSYATRGLTMPDIPVRAELTSPGGEPWVFGEDDAVNVVRGTATDFCRVCTQRRHLADTGIVIEGDAAREWMEIAQAFAGPPGQGRQPGEFPREPAPK